MKYLVMNDFQWDLLKMIFKGVKMLNDDALLQAEMHKDSEAIETIKTVAKEIEEFRRSIFGGEQ